ncbi:MAG: glycosyltransferase family 39 protein [Acidobacteriota bacterium]|nr:glycosyltransferase family 39 protein [Acidobacteriota bacterium]
MKSVLSVAIVAIGVLFRLYLYFRNPSFYTDEILLALNVLTRDFAGLLAPLDLAQVAPVLFLWMQKLSIGILGPGEASFRLPTLLFGIALLPLVYRCALRFTGRESAALCTALAAFSPALLRYSTESKQYGIEPAISAALLLLAAPLLDAEVPPRRRYFLIAGGVLALALSLPSIFVLGGVWMALALTATQKHRWKQDFLWLGAAGALWVALFAVIYFKLYAYAANSPYMIQFWTPGYLASQGSLYGALHTAIKGFLDPVFALEGKLPTALLLAAGLILALGIWTFWERHGSPIPVMLVAPLVAALGAAAIGKWVFTTRLMLFSVPLTILLLGAGADALCARFQPQWQRIAMAVLAVALVAAPLRYDAWILRHPTLDGVRAAVRLGLNRSQSGDEIYVYAGALPGWTFYSVNWSAPEHARVTRLLDAMKQIGPNPGNAPSRGRPVQHEAFDLQWDLDGKWEIPGIASGVQSTIHGSGPGEPDPGWADNEVSRIRQTGSSTVFVVVSEYRAPVVEPLLTGLSAAGGTATREFHDNGGALYQVKFLSRH